MKLKYFMLSALLGIVGRPVTDWWYQGNAGNA